MNGYKEPISAQRGAECKRQPELENIGERLAKLYGEMANTKERLMDKKLRLFGSYPMKPEPTPIRPDDNPVNGIVPAIRETVSALENIQEEIKAIVLELENL